MRQWHRNEPTVDAHEVGDYEQADAIRNNLAELGVQVEDSGGESTFHFE